MLKYLLPIALLVGSLHVSAETKLGGLVVNKVPSAAAGYTAYLVEKDGKQRIVYEQRSSNYLTYGILFDFNGNNLTTIDAAKLTGNAKPSNKSNYKPSLGVMPLDLYKYASGLSYLAAPGVKPTANPVYIAFDPNCPYCKALYSKIKSNPIYAKKDIRWIPVAALTEGRNGDSQRKSSALLRDRATGYFKIDNVQPQKETLTDAEINRLDDNLMLLVKANTTKIPSIIYKNKDGKSTSLIAGSPTDKELQYLFGAP